MVWQSIWIGVLKLKIDTNKCNAHIFIDFKQQLHSFTSTISAESEGYHNDDFESHNQFLQCVHKSPFFFFL